MLGRVERVGEEEGPCEPGRPVLNEDWATWSLPSNVCLGDSGGPIFLDDHLADGKGHDGKKHDAPHRAEPSGQVNAVDREVEDLVALQWLGRGQRCVLGAERVVQDEWHLGLRDPAVGAKSMTRQS